MRGFSWLEKLVLIKVHPRKIMVDLAAWNWMIYFIWRHEWQMAIGVVIVAGIFGWFLTKNINYSAMATTTLGRLALLHLHPFNLSFQMIGAAALLSGVWNHSPEYILSGVSLILLGHIFGWSKVDARL